MKCCRDFLKKKIKIMNNKMLINKYLSTIESKKQTKQTRTDRIMDTESILMVVRWEGVVGGMGEEMWGLISTNRC